MWWQVTFWCHHVYVMTSKCQFGILIFVFNDTKRSLVITYNNQNLKVIFWVCHDIKMMSWHTQNVTFKKSLSKCHSECHISKTCDLSMSWHQNVTCHYTQKPKCHVTNSCPPDENTYELVLYTNPHVRTCPMYEHARKDSCRHIRTYVYTHMCVYTYTYVYTRIDIHTHMYLHTHVYTHTYTHICVFTHTYVFTHTCFHKHVCIHIH